CLRRHAHARCPAQRHAGHEPWVPQRPRDRDPGGAAGGHGGARRPLRAARRKCFCGNPLTAPRPVRAPRYTGPRWPGFAPGGIVVIDQSTTVVNVFTVVDPATGETFGRPSGTTGDSDGPVPPPLTGPAGQTLGTGAVQVTLQWSSAADLDLHVVDPTGTEISYQQRNASSGGSLDVD